MNYVTYDAAGALTGGYLQELHPDHVDHFIEVSADLRAAWTSYRANPERDGLELIPPAVDLPALRARLVASVDDHIAAITTRWTRFETEYVEREAAARAFAAGGYVGDPGIWVTGFAVPAGLSNTAAANLIISQADGLRAALELLGAQRMAKYNIVGAGTAAAAQAAHDTIIAQSNLIAAAL